MNDWSPGGNLIRQETTKHTARSLRSKWDESGNGPATEVASLRAASSNRTKSRQRFKENISKTSLSMCNKSRCKTGESVISSDPRFKQIISPRNHINACIGTETKKSKSTLDLYDAFKSKPANWTPPEFKPKQSCGDSADNTESTKPDPPAVANELESKATNVTETQKQEPSQDNLKLVEKLGFNHSLVESVSKESLSGSCISTVDASLASEESVADYTNDVEPLSPSTRVKKVHKWIKDQQNKLDKKQSVITVIGQTQGTETLSSALQKIDKRRKLVKQLDKYAICKKIIDSEKDNDISELLAKVSCLTQTGKFLFSANAIESTKMITNEIKSAEDHRDKYCSVSDNEKPVHDVNSKSNLQQYESVKENPKKSDVLTKCSIKGTTRLVLSRIPYGWIFSALIFLCVILWGITYITIQSNQLMSFDLFTPKPKPLTWYEKIGVWIWELFRPSANYRRTAPWEQYLN